MSLHQMKRSRREFLLTSSSGRLEHIFHAAEELNIFYSSERQPNCEARRGQCENNHQWKRPYLNHNHSFRRQMRYLHIKMKLLQPHQLQSTNNPEHQSFREHQQETEKISTDLENLYPQICLKKEGGCDGFK